MDASNVWAANMFGGTTSSDQFQKSIPPTSNLTTLNSSNFGGMTGIATNGTDVWASNSLGGSSALGSVTDTKVATGKTTQILSTTFNWPTAIAATANDLWVTNEYGGSEGNGSVSVISLSSSGTSIGTKTTVPGRPTGVRRDGRRRLSCRDVEGASIERRQSHHGIRGNRDAWWKDLHREIDDVHRNGLGER